MPNAGEGLKRLKYWQDWDISLCAYLKKLDQIKPVILCGDMNVAHHPIGKQLPMLNSKYRRWLASWLMFADACSTAACKVCVSHLNA